MVGVFCLILLRRSKRIFINWSASMLKQECSINSSLLNLTSASWGHSNIKGCKAESFMWLHVLWGYNLAVIVWHANPNESTERLKSAKLSTENLKRTNTFLCSRVQPPLFSQQPQPYAQLKPPDHRQAAEKQRCRGLNPDSKINPCVSSSFTDGRLQMCVVISLLTSSLPPHLL